MPRRHSAQTHLWLVHVLVHVNGSNAFHIPSKRITWFQFLSFINHQSDRNPKTCYIKYLNKTRREKNTKNHFWHFIFISTMQGRQQAAMQPNGITKDKHAHKHTCSLRQRYLSNFIWLFVCIYLHKTTAIFRISISKFFPYMQRIATQRIHPSIVFIWFGWCVISSIKRIYRFIFIFG